MANKTSFRGIISVLYDIVEAIKGVNLVPEISICQVKGTPAQTIPNATFTVVNFDAVDFNFGSAFSDDLTNNGIKADESCLAKLIFFLRFTDTALGGTRLLQIHINNIVQAQIPMTNDQTLSHRTALNGVFILELNKGDIVTLKLYQDTGGNLNTSINSLLCLEKII